MVKRKSIRTKVKARSTAKTHSEQQQPQNAPDGQTQGKRPRKRNLGAQKLQPKRASKKDPKRQKAFLERVQRSSLATKPASKKTKRKSGQTLANFQDLADALKETTNVSVKKGAKRGLAGKAVTSKQRQRLASTESFRLQQVAGHARFKINPLSAVAAHLEATLPKPEPPTKKTKLKVQAKRK